MSFIGFRDSGPVMATFVKSQRTLRQLCDFEHAKGTPATVHRSYFASFSSIIHYDFRFKILMRFNWKRVHNRLLFVVLPCHFVMPGAMGRGIGADSLRCFAVSTNIAEGVCMCECNELGWEKPSLCNGIDSNLHINFPVMQCARAWILQFDGVSKRNSLCWAAECWWKLKLEIIFCIYFE